MTKCCDITLFTKVRGTKFALVTNLFAYFSKSANFVPIFAKSKKFEHLVDKLTHYFTISIQNTEVKNVDSCKVQDILLIYIEMTHHLWYLLSHRRDKHNDNLSEKN